MLTKCLLEEILIEALKTGGDFAEIFEEQTYTTSISMLNEVVENANSGVIHGIGIRIYHETESVYAYTNDLERDNVIKMASKLAGSIKGEQVIQNVHLEEVVYENQHKVKISPRTYNRNKKVAFMLEANRGAAEYDDCIHKVMTGYRDQEQHIVVANSEGLYIQDTRILTRMSVQAIANDGDLMETGFYAPGASKGMEFYEEDINPYEVGIEAARIAKIMLYADECPAGVMPVIIDNGFGGVIFHEACGHSLEARAVAKGQSVFANKLGEQIANTCVTAIDDGTIPYAWGSSNIDDEGRFQQKRVLIENGILKSYLIDQLNGRRMGMASTASSRRQSYKYQTSSRMTNTYIANGNDCLDDMIKEISYGLYAKTMGGGSVDPSTGDFNFSVNEAYIIRDGKIEKPVKGATLIGNGADILMHIDRVANNLKREQGMCGSSSGSIATDVGQPAIRVSQITVGGKEGGCDHE